MINLKTVIEKYPQCMESSWTLRSFLKDIYPEDMLHINLAVNVYEAGIAKKISSMSYVDEQHMRIFMRRLENDYGLQSDNAQTAIRLWAAAYGIRTAAVSADTADRHDPEADEYVVREYGDQVSIKRYKGSRTVVNIPREINGKRVTGIYSYAFAQCDVQKVRIADTVDRVHSHTFACCERLTEVIIPDSVRHILEGAFEYCNELEDIQLPDSVTTIGSEAFLGCKSLTGIIIPNSVKYIEDNAFEGSGLKKIVIPNSVEHIGSHVFHGCKNLKKITLPNNIEEIKDSMFYFCKSLEQMIIPDSVRKIEYNAFCGCDNLKKVMIPDSVTEINSFAFFNCSDLTIYCTSNSEAHRYAEANNIKIGDMDNIWF